MIRFLVRHYDSKSRLSFFTACSSAAVAFSILLFASWLKIPAAEIGPCWPLLAFQTLYIVLDIWTFSVWNAYMDGKLDEMMATLARMESHVTEVSARIQP